MADANTQADSVKHTKLNIGPLPKQFDDHQKYEQTEILWGRVAFAVGLALLVLVLLLTWLFGGFEAAEKNVAEPAKTEALPANKSVQGTELPVFEQGAEPAKPAEVEQAIAKALQAKAKTSDAVVSADPVDQAFKQAPLSEQTPIAKAQAPLVAQVELLHPGLSQLVLRHTLADGKPLPPFGYQVEMPAEGIIKVVLDAQMNNLKGTVTYHEWYRGDKRMARVKIPVNVAKQSSYSSKFINQQMRGDWLVKVLDQNAKLLGQARFRVQ